MGVDLTWADAAAMIHRREACQKSGPECGHERTCHDDLEPFPLEVEFPYRQFADVSETMVRLGMGYEAEAPHERAQLETDQIWAAWIEWLRQSREHGGFEVE